MAASQGAPSTKTTGTEQRAREKNRSCRRRADCPQRERWTAPALGVAGLVLVFSLAMSVQAWAPMLDQPRSFDLAMVPQETVAMPVGWRPGR